MVYKLFPEDRRDLEGNKPQGMSDYEYLARSLRPEIAAICREWENEFAKYPQDHHASLRGCFCSKINRQHISAVFELFLFRLFQRMGFQVNVHPNLDTNTLHHPDFEISREGREPFYLEAKCVFGDDIETKGEQTKKAIYDAINSIDANNYKLELFLDGAAERNPRLTRIRKAVQSWLESMEYSTLKEKYDQNGIDGLPIFNLEEAGYIIKIRPIPISPDTDKSVSRRCIWLYHPYSEAKRSNTHELIRTALGGKGQHYGKTNIPLIIALNVTDFAFDEIDIFNALLGDEVVYFPRSNAKVPAQLSSLPTRKNNGFWTADTGPTYTRVAACLFFKWVSVDRYKDQLPVIVYNPYVDPMKLLSDVCYFERYVPNQQEGTLDKIDGKGILSLYCSD